MVGTIRTIVLSCQIVTDTTAPRRTRSDGERSRRTILRAAAQHNRLDIPGVGLYPCVGVYAGVASGGTVRRGDPVAVD